MIETALAWLLPLLAGTGLWALVLGRPNGRAAWLGVLGYGYLCGIVLTASLTALLASNHTQHALGRVGPVLALCALLAWGWCWYRPAPRVALPASGRVLDTAQKLLMAALLGLLAIRLLMLLDEVWLRPTFPWDAWAAWAVKSKSWFLLGHAEPYVSAAAWLQQGDVALRTTATWNYPGLLGWMQVWFASAAGEWNEPLVNLPWVGIWLALLLSSYAQWRVLGLSALHAVIATYALGSLPLLNAHVALAGYADLWLAALLGMAVLQWLVWYRQRRPMQLLMALALGLCLPAIKLEGGVWMACFFVAMVFGVLPRRAQGWLCAGMVAVIGIGLALGGIEVPVPGLGLVHVAWGEIDIPALGSLVLQWHAVGAQMFASLYSLPNWHLLWFVAPFVLLLRWRVLLREDAARLLAGLLLLCWGFLFVLFFFTDASRWAEDFTSANRLIMHVTPATVTLLALLLRDAGRRTIAVDGEAVATVAATVAQETT